MKVKIDLEKARKRNTRASEDFHKFCEKNVDTIFDMSELLEVGGDSRYTHAIVGSICDWHFCFGEDLVECENYSVDIKSIIDSAYPGV